MFKLIYALGFASFGSGALLWYRMHVVETTTYRWLLVPNLILAWIPFLLAWWTTARWHAHRKLTIDIWLAGIVWLLFYPNAPYIVTDIAHITWVDESYPVQVDVLLNVLTAFTALMVGFSSLKLMQRIVNEVLHRLWGWIFAYAVLAVSSVGVFLGRYLRWNSWDIFRKPLEILADALDALQQPEAVLFIAAFFFFQLCSYQIFYHLAGSRLVPLHYREK